MHCQNDKWLLGRFIEWKSIEIRGLKWVWSFAKFLAYNDSKWACVHFKLRTLRIRKGFRGIMKIRKRPRLVINEKGHSLCSSISVRRRRRQKAFIENFAVSQITKTEYTNIYWTARWGVFVRVRVPFFFRVRFVRLWCMKCVLLL